MTNDNTRERIGFIGAGMMGTGICSNLLKAGYPLTVIANRNRARIDELVATGAKEASTLADLVASSDIVMLCVNSADTVAEIVRGAIGSMRPGMMVVDITTSLPEVSRTLAGELAAIDVRFVDAPVVGGPAQSAQGQLGSFVGASADDLARVEPILRIYSVDVEHFGPVGSGNTAKLLNNFLTVGLRQLVVHSFRAARRNDIDFAKLYTLAAKGAAGSRTLDQFIQGAIVGDYRRGTAVNTEVDMIARYVERLLAGGALAPA